MARCSLSGDRPLEYSLKSSFLPHKIKTIVVSHYIGLLANDIIDLGDRIQTNNNYRYLGKFNSF